MAYSVAMTATALNNAYKTNIRQTPNEALYGFRPSEALDLLRHSEPANPSNLTTAKATGILASDVYSTKSITESQAATQARRKLMTTMTSYRPSLIDAQDAMAWAAMQAKHYYNINHQPRFFQVGDEVLLRLH